MGYHPTVHQQIADHIAGKDQPGYVAPYAWIIDRDHLSEPGDKYDNTGTMGPSQAPDTLLERLRNDSSAGRTFRMRDDDGELYYTGRILVIGDRDPLEHDDVEGFEPLDDVGRPDSGCTSIEYRNAAGQWEVL